ncbi:unnamed protein product [Ixodes pacificus]
MIPAAGDDIISPTTPSSSPLREPSQELCRFCASGGDQEQLVTPCNCEGVVSLSHRSCLEKRILQNGLTRCYLCNFRYQYSVTTRSARHWIGATEHRHDVFQLLTMLVQCVCDFLVMVIAVSEGTEFVARAPVLAAMVTVLACGSCVVFWFVYLLADLWAFYAPLRRWLRHNTRVELLWPALDESQNRNTWVSTDELR